MTEWRAIPSAPHYLVSSDGQVRHHQSDKPRKFSTTPRGYKLVNFWNEGKLRVKTVHSLIAETFHGPRPDGCEVRHLDGNPANNHASNLAYGTKVENAADRERHGNTMRGQRNGNAKIADTDVECIRLLYAGGKASQYELAALFRTSQAQVHNIVRNKQRIGRAA